MSLILLKVNSEGSESVVKRDNTDFMLCTMYIQTPGIVFEVILMPQSPSVVWKTKSSNAQISPSAYISPYIHETG